MRFLRTVQAGGLELPAEYAANSRDADDFLYLAVTDYLFTIHHASGGFVFDKQHRHRFAYAYLGEFQHLACTLAVQGDGNLWTAAVAVKTGACVDDLVAGRDVTILQQVVAAITVLVQARTRRDLAVTR